MSRPVSRAASRVISRTEWWLRVVVPGRLVQAGYALRRSWFRCAVCPARRHHRVKFNAERLRRCVDCGARV